MKRHIKKLLAVALCLMLAAGALTALAADGDGVSLRVEGISENVLFEKSIPYAGETVLELLSAALDANGVEYVAGGGYLSEIAGEQAGAFGGWDGWVYYVNGEEAAVSMAECTLAEGDSVLVCYADPYGENPTLLPNVSAEKLNGIVTLTFSAQLATFDADWNMTVSTVPLAGVSVAVDLNEYLTDENGNVVLNVADSAKARVALQIDKCDENGKPLVVRFEPGYTFELPHGTIEFSDISDNIWYKDFVIQLVQLGAINGYGDGTFRPTAAITRAEFVKILACLDAEFDAESTEFKKDFADVDESDWFAPYVMWAADRGFVEKGGNFNPATSLAREDMALYSYRMAVEVLGKQLPDENQAPAFTDDAQISAHCREAVYMLQKAGIIEGVGNGTYAPHSSTQRSQVAKMVAMIYNLQDAQ